MKKTILVLAILLGSISANAQWLPVGEVNFKHYGVGFQAGALGLGKEVTRFAIGANVLAYGVYMDFLYSAPQHAHDPKVTLWDDNSGYAIHVGYQIPILTFLRVIPIIGYAEVNKGITDGTKYSYDYSVTDKRWVINNEYTKTWDDGGFDAGGSVVLNIGKVNVFVTGTMSSVYGGVGVAF